jgi:molybdenum cofactor guanylyltransferase
MHPQAAGYHSRMTAVAGVVLAGGRSSRMGRSKAGLEWHGSTLLRRVTGVVARAVDGPVIVVRAPGQRLPALAPDVLVLDDPREGVGPLQGLAVGLHAAASRSAAAAFVCSTDMPLLHPAFVRHMTAALRDGVDVAMPVAHGHPQPLAAVYRTALAADVARWLEDGERRLAAVAARSRVALVRPEDLLADGAVADADPELASLRNLNRPEDYRTARALVAPAVTVHLRAGRSAPERVLRVPAATVGDAAAQLGLTMDRVVVEIDGGATSDATMPLVDGDQLVVTDLAYQSAAPGRAVDDASTRPGADEEGET